MRQQYVMGMVVRLVAVLLLMVTASGCTVYSAAVDERNVKTIASDTKLKLAIEKHFLDDSLVKVLDISAFVYDGNAYLTGEYDTQAERQRAIELAGKVRGVRSVTSYLLVKNKKDFCGTTDNLALAAKVKRALIEDKDIWATNINVEAVQCHIVLLGIVGSKVQVRKAVAHAEAVTGVRSVESYLRVSGK